MDRSTTPSESKVETELPASFNDSEPEDYRIQPTDAGPPPSQAGNWMMQQLAIDAEDEFDPLSIRYGSHGY